MDVPCFSEGGNVSNTSFMSKFFLDRDGYFENYFIRDSHYLLNWCILFLRRSFEISRRIIQTFIFKYWSEDEGLYYLIDHGLNARMVFVTILSGFSYSVDKSPLLIVRLVQGLETPFPLYITRSATGVERRNLMKG